MAAGVRGLFTVLPDQVVVWRQAASRGAYSRVPVSCLWQSWRSLSARTPTFSHGRPSPSHQSPPPSHAARENTACNGRVEFEPGPNSTEVVEGDGDECKWWVHRCYGRHSSCACSPRLWMWRQTARAWIQGWKALRTGTAGAHGSHCNFKLNLKYGADAATPGHRRFKLPKFAGGAARSTSPPLSRLGIAHAGRVACTAGVNHWHVLAPAPSEVHAA